VSNQELEDQVEMLSVVRGKMSAKAIERDGGGRKLQMAEVGVGTVDSKGPCLEGVALAVFLDLQFCTKGRKLSVARTTLPLSYNSQGVNIRKQNTSRTNVTQAS
jgi:hypothetical protein